MMADQISYSSKDAGSTPKKKVKITSKADLLKKIKEDSINWQH